MVENQTLKVFKTFRVSKFLKKGETGETQKDRKKSVRAVPTKSSPYHKPAVLDVSWLADSLCRSGQAGNGSNGRFLGSLNCAGF